MKMRHLVLMIALAGSIIWFPADRGLASGGFGMNMEGTYMPIGIAIGTKYEGFEASLVRFEDTWYGIYAEALRHRDGDSYMTGAGLEAGAVFIGMDAAVLGFFKDEERLLGFSARALVTFPGISAYVRYAQVLGADDFFEFGILVKFPFIMR